MIVLQRPRARAAQVARRLLRICAPVIALSLVASTVRAQDTVTLKDGKTESGRIKSTDYEGVVIEAKGQSKTLEWPTVANIAYKDPPAEYTSGRDSFDNAKFDEAIQFFDALKADTKLRAPIKQEALFFSAQAQLGKGAWDAAIAAYDALRMDFPKGRYLQEVGEGYVTAFSAKKDFPGAQKALDAMAGDAASQGVAPGFAAAISVLKGRLLEDQGKVAEASASYSLAEKAAGVTLAVQQQARLGQGRCMLLLKKPADAEGVFRKLTGEDASNAVLAGAWNGLGDVWLEDARNKTDVERTDKLLDAAHAFMHGVVQYGPGPGESTREYCRALAGTVKAFQGLEAGEKNAEKKQTYKLRAFERNQQLQRECGGG